MNDPSQIKEKTVASTQRQVYRTLWRWHFYAGVFCIPFVITLAISGAIFLFKPQFERWVDHPFNQLQVSEQRATPNQIITTAQAAYPGSKFMAYHLPETPRHSVVVRVSAAGERIQVYVDPYRNQVLKSIPYADQFMQQVRSFHGELLAGRFGSVLVELAACWALVLIVTGLYLWWPRSAKGMAGVLYPRLSKSGRVFWRDLHAVIGVWLSAFTLFLLVSGLPWALVWGAAFKEVRQWGAEPVVQDWTQTQAQERASWRPSIVERIDLPEVVIAEAQALSLASPVQISAAGDDFKVSSQTQNRPQRADVWLNRTGEVVKARDFADKSVVDRVVGVGIAAHEGYLFGWFNLILGVVTTLGLVVLSVSGAVLWWRRRPSGKLGAPAPIHTPRVGRVLVGLVLLLGVLLPVVGLSLIALVLLEFILLRRWQTSRRWLGLA
ncbi:PepSY-associated TM helix domain-containing protein [Gilvimarinus sp. 1_MG-2023]|uniref:PepSY-associated TM helix domain-containing protein n=1 Tax=Gilvimarinus sp. 1_MG-2023 TaxID=3062638 RepID=UPI0026E428E4|nr:PepSY domain-containing protein [Gilvimarinus sp. 1_MG-2023]MDO6747030.1 PepSY domain-containing protein [Gilvimarinus sp. 1_MG-2023]